MCRFSFEGTDLNDETPIIPMCAPPIATLALSGDV